MPVQPTKALPRVGTSADGHGIVGHAGALLLVELADRLGSPRRLAGGQGAGRPGGIAITPEGCCGILW